MLAASAPPRPSRARARRRVPEPAEHFLLHLHTNRGVWYGRTMSAALYVLGSRRPQPMSKRTIFADGSADETFRDDVDLELSHWLPNRTPQRAA